MGLLSRSYKTSWCSWRKRRQNECELWNKNTPCTDRNYNRPYNSMTPDPLTCCLITSGQEETNQLTTQDWKSIQIPELELNLSPASTYYSHTYRTSVYRCKLFLRSAPTIQTSTPHPREENQGFDMMWECCRVWDLLANKDACSKLWNWLEISCAQNNEPVMLLQIPSSSATSAATTTSVTYARVSQLILPCTSSKIEGMITFFSISLEQKDNHTKCSFYLHFWM